MRQIVGIILDVGLHLERIVVDLVGQIFPQGVLCSTYLHVHRMLSRLLRRQLVGLYHLIGECLLIGLPRLLVVDGESYGIGVGRASVLECHFKRVGLAVLIEDDLSVEIKREVLDKICHGK